MMVSTSDDNRQLTFKRNVSLEQFGKALKKYDDLVKLFGGRTAKYDEFTDWLVANDFVDASPSIGEIKKMMETPNA